MRVEQQPVIPNNSENRSQDRKCFLQFLKQQPGRLRKELMPFPEKIGCRAVRFSLGQRNKNKIFIASAPEIDKRIQAKRIPKPASYQDGCVKGKVIGTCDEKLGWINPGEDLPV